MKHYIPYALHIPVKNPDGSVASGQWGNGAPANGNVCPAYDTLIALLNPYQFAVTARLQFFGMDGQPRTWGDGLPYRDYVLSPESSMATTLIPGNIFPDPPLDFIGHATVDFLHPGPMSPSPSECSIKAMICGGGFFPGHWNKGGAHVPVVRDVVIPRNYWQCPYSIPFFQDYNHGPLTYARTFPQHPWLDGVVFEDTSYRTGLVITNFDSFDASFVCKFKVGVPYPGAGDVFTFSLLCGAGKTVVHDLYGLLLNAGYAHNRNSEGWLSISSGLRVAAVPYLLCSNATYDNWSVGLAFD